MPAGAYLSTPYYSRAYLQPFELRPGQNPLIIRLAPIDNYARYRLGGPVPGLTNGSVDSNVFPYRYGPDFTPRPLSRRDATMFGPPKAGMGRGAP